MVVSPHRFPSSFPVRHDTSTGNDVVSVTGKFIVTESLEMLTFLLNRAKFKAGNSVDSPAVPGLNLA